MLNLFKFGNDAHPMQQMFCIHFFKRLGPPKNIFWSYGRGGQGKAFYSLQPFSCPYLVRPLVKACHFRASYNFPMSFQNLSTYPLSDPNSWLENHLQDPPRKGTKMFIPKISGSCEAFLSNYIYTHYFSFYIYIVYNLYY